jgi:hypothetical protein
MQVLVNPLGGITCGYTEAIDLAALGRPTIHRASHVEPDDQGQWNCDLSPVNGPQLGPFDFRSEALDAERAWLDRHWLGGWS